MDRFHKSIYEFINQDMEQGAFMIQLQFCNYCSSVVVFSRDHIYEPSTYKAWSDYSLGLDS